MNAEMGALEKDLREIGANVERSLFLQEEFLRVRWNRLGPSQNVHLCFHARL